MKRYSLTFLLLIASLLLVASSAFADNQMIDHEGKLVIHASQQAKEVAEDSSYHNNYARKVDTEAGAEVIASPKAQLAAKLYRYNQPGAFAKRSDEAGTNYFASEHQSVSVHKAIAKLDDKDLFCPTC